MKKPPVLCLILTVFILPAFFPMICGADLIILKTGEKFNVRESWEEHKNICFYLDGALVSVEKRHVEKIIAGDSSGEDSSSPEEIRKQAPALESDVFGYSQTGFGDLMWGMHPSDINGLQKINTDPAYGGVDQFVREDEKRRYGRADVTRIAYGFWRDRLYTITIWTHGDANYKRLKKEAFRLFGKGAKPDKNKEKYIWYTGRTDRLLQYDFMTDTGLLWFRSRRLDDEVKRLYPD